MLTLPNHQSDPPPRRSFLNVREAAEALRLDESTLYRHLREGRFPGVKIGGRYLVPASVIAELVNEAMASGSCVTSSGGPSGGAKTGPPMRWRAATLPAQPGRRAVVRPDGGHVLRSVRGAGRRRGARGFRGQGASGRIVYGHVDVETQEFSGYVAACACGWRGTVQHRPVEAGERAATDEWDREHLRR